MSGTSQMVLALPDAADHQITPPKLVRGDRIERLGVTYEFVAKAEGGKKFIRLDTGTEVYVSNIQLIKEMEKREVRMAVPSWVNEARKKKWHLDFHSRPELEKRHARMRNAYVQAFQDNRDLGFPKTVAAVRDAVYRKRIADPANMTDGETAPSVASIYNWMKLAEAPEGPSTIKRLCFAETSRGQRGPKLADEVKPIVLEALRALWYTSQRHRSRTVWDRIVAEANARGVATEAIPCRRTIHRLIKALPPYVAMRERFGARVADHKLRSVGQLEEAAFPGQVYEVDAHKLDYVAVDDSMGLPLGRLWVTVVIDRCTRMIVGLHLHVEPPSALTIAAALRNAFAPKSYMLMRWPGIGRQWHAWGLPNLIILDNGLENHATFLIEALEELGVAWRFADPRTPEDKANIERWFGTTTRDFTARLPGWTGSNPVHKGDYDAMGMACLTLGQADELMHRWIVAYNIGLHEGIRDIPERLWLEKTAELEVTPIEDMGMLDVLLGDYAMRTPGPKGIHLLGLRFGDLGDWRPIELIRTRAGAAAVTQVRIRFDRSDLSFIHVQDPVTKEYIPVRSLDPDYTNGMTLARHRIIRRHAVERCRGYVTVAELSKARDDLQRRIDEMTGHEPMTERRFAAVFNGLGSKGSWADFYRLADTEYGEGRREDARSVVDLMETDEGWGAEEPPTKRSASEPARNTSDAASGFTVSESASATVKTSARRTSAHGVKARADKLGIEIEGVEMPDEAETSMPELPHPELSQEHANTEFAARMAALGIELD